MPRHDSALRRLTIVSILLILAGLMPSVWPYIAERLPSHEDWWFTHLSLVPFFDFVSLLWAAALVHVHLLRFVGIALLVAALGSAWFETHREKNNPSPAEDKDLLRVSDVLREEAELTTGLCLDESLRKQMNNSSLGMAPHDPVARGMARAGSEDNAAEVCNKVPPAMYHWLNGQDRTALCLSGGGIRSASFALGVIQALASYPGRLSSKRGTGASFTTDLEAEQAGQKSFLAHITFLSTVSGGGYIGSWLSAWMQRYPLSDVWRGLARPPNPLSDPGDEAQQLRWLRDHSNYMTPKLGLTSLDTLADIAIFLRNTLLNWFILVPLLCVALLAIKLFELLVFSLSFNNSAVLFVWFAAIAFLLLLWALVFRLRNIKFDPDVTSASDQEPVRHAPGQTKIFWYGLVPSVLAALAFTLCLALASATQTAGAYGGWVFELFGPFMRVVKQVVERDGVSEEISGGAFILPHILLLGCVCGTLIYALSWLLSWPRRRGFAEFWRWSLSGTVYGLIVAGLVYFFSRTHAIDWSFYTPEDWFCSVTGQWPGWICAATPPQLGGTRHALALLYLGVPLLLFAQLIAEMIFVGLKSDSDDDEREWLGRFAGLTLLAGFGWMAIVFLTCVGSDIAVRFVGNSSNWFIVAALYMVGALAAAIGRHETAPSQNPNPDRKSKSKFMALTTIAGLCAVSLVILTSAVLDVTVLGEPIAGPVTTAADTAQLRDKLTTMFWQILTAIAVAATIATVASKTINVNRFSMHALYRNRLVRTFLGASVKDRNPNPFTGFDHNDNPRMHSLGPRVNRVGPGQTTKELWRPFHIVNIALNVSSSKNLAWQERKAASFTVSPLHCGSAHTGYRRSRSYGGPNGISLGTAMAISGAAASPNMGSFTSAAMAFLMVLFNVRMGWWLGNPGPEGATTFKHDGPKTAVRPLLNEMIGNTRDDQEYVYLSDGGHFENLGLYEMVRRRCGYIIVSDAGYDPDYTFVDLGNAVRKIQIDLGVRISFFGLDKLKPRVAGADCGPAPYHAIGEINYPAADGLDVQKGIILYIKPGYHGTESSAGIRSYAMSNDQFPHDETSNQWFGESQLESYRALGFEITDKIMREAVDKTWKGGERVTLQDVLRTLDHAATGRPAVRRDPELKGSKLTI